MMTWINPSAIEQLQREVDALKVKAAPTPAEDEEVTPDMCAAASRTWDKQTSWSSAATWAAIYRAMRAARAPAPTPEPSAELVAQPSELRLLKSLLNAVLLAPPSWWRAEGGYGKGIYEKMHIAVADALDALDAAEEAK
jgi:hypothetical protein